MQPMKIYESTVTLENLYFPPDDPEDPGERFVTLFASNGQFSGTVTIDFSQENLLTIARALHSFPRQYPDTYFYEQETSDGLIHYAGDEIKIALSTPTLSSCRIDLYFYQNGGEMPSGSMSRFSITLETWALKQLGDLFEQFATREHIELSWSNKNATPTWPP